MNPIDRLLDASARNDWPAVIQAADEIVRRYLDGERRPYSDLSERRKISDALERCAELLPSVPCIPATGTSYDDRDQT
jgi:hypothetical protein